MPLNTPATTDTSVPADENDPARTIPRLAVIGPIPPWQGGIAHHTSQLCERLTKTHQLLTISFASMYPNWLYPGPGNEAPADLSAAANPQSATRFLIDGVSPRSWRKVVDAIDEFKPEAVVLPWWTVFWAPFCIYTVRTLRRRGIATVFLCHNVSDHESAWWKQRLAAMALAHGAAFITHTNAARDRLLALLPSAAVSVYPHPCYQHFPPPLRVPARRARLELLFFGYVRHYKGVDLLIEALGCLSELDFHLHIAGEFWINPAALRDRIEQLGLNDRITLTPRYVDDQEAAGLFTLADALVLPYREASGSGVAALALHYHTPVIASRVGGLAEAIVDGETGFLVPPGDPAALASGILRLLQARDWRQLIDAHRQTASWEGLAAAIDRSIATIRPPCGTGTGRCHHSQADNRQ